MFGIAMSNTDPNMAIPGTIGMTIGNNPFSYAYPKENGQSVFLDIALSATAALKINKAKQAHEQIPNTWLIDDHGNATTDPSWYGNGGALQPIAAYKGYGLSRHGGSTYGNDVWRVHLPRCAELVFQS